MKGASRISPGKSSERDPKGAAGGTGSPKQKTSRRESDRDGIRAVFAIDPRSLATFRIAAALLLLVDLGFRAADLRSMYSDDGMFPRSVVCHHYSTIWNWSFHFASGSSSYQAALFGVAACFALALLTGFKSRIAAIGSWLMLVSVQHRVPPILSGADVLLRMLLFWAMFLPLGRRWSVDAFWKDSQPDEARDVPIRSIASAAILLQMGLMYLFTAILKMNASWLSGEALSGIMAHDFFVSSIGAHVASFPTLLRWLTWGTLLLEWVAPVLLFVPSRNSRLRLVALASLVVLHLAISIFLEVDTFSFVCLAGLTLFLPRDFWESPWLQRFVGRTEARRAVVREGGNFARAQTSAGWISQGLIALALLFVIAVNLSGLSNRPATAFSPDRWRSLTTGLGLGQKWNMFEQAPSKSGWYVAEAQLRNRSGIDLLRHGSAIDWSRPGQPLKLYPNYRWRKIFREMAYEDELGYQMFRRPVSEFLCKQWNRAHGPGEQIMHFNLFYCMREPGGGTGESSADVTTIVREPLLSLDFRESEIKNQPN